MKHQQALQTPSSYLSQQQYKQQPQKQQQQQNLQQQFGDSFGSTSGSNMAIKMAQVQPHINPSHFPQARQSTLLNSQQIGYDQQALANQFHENGNSTISKQQIPPAFYHPHNVGFHQNNKQEFQQYQHQYQQQFRQVVASSQQHHQEQLSHQHQFYQQQAIQQNSGRLGNSYPNQQQQQQQQNQWNNNPNNQQQPLQMNKHQHPNSQYNQNQQQFQPFPINSHQQEQDEQGSPSLVLLVMVFELKDLSITNDQIQEIFFPFGFVNKVLIFVKNPDQTKAFVEMESIESAKRAKEALNKAKIHLTPHQKYKFKVHYSQTTELNLCNYKTEGRDYRTLASQNVNKSTASLPSSSASISHQDNSQLNYHQKSEKIPQTDQTNQYSNVLEKQFSNSQQTSSYYSIPSPNDRNSPSLGSGLSNNGSVLLNQNGSHHHFKKVSNSFGQTIGAITYVEKGQQSQESKNDQLYQYNAIISPPQAPQKLQQGSNSYSQASQQQQSVQIYTNSMPSLTSTSTPTSQGNLAYNMTAFQQGISLNKNESGMGFQQDLSQAFSGLSINNNNQQAQVDINGDDGDNIRTNCGLGANFNPAGGESLNGFTRGGNGIFKDSSSLLLTKLESCESFNQGQDQGCMSNQNLPEFNLQQIGITNTNNHSNQHHQQMIDISPRKGSLVLINSDIFLQQSHQQENNLQTSNSQLPQHIQSKEYDILNHCTPSQTQLNRQSMVDSFHNTKSTCSTSSPSPFHTSYFGVTPPTITNSQKIHSYQHISKLECIQLSSADITSNNIPSSAGLLHNHHHNLHHQNHNANIKYPHSSLSQLHQSPPYVFSTPLIQERSLDLISSSSNHTIQDEINNSQLSSLHIDSKQDSQENTPLQSIQQLQQQQSCEESPVIYVKNVKINELQPENIYNIFRNFGYVHSILFLKDNKTVLIQYEESNQAKMAINQLNNVQFLGDEQMRITFGKRKSITLPPAANQRNNQSNQNQQKNGSSNNNNTSSLQNNIKSSEFYVNKNNDPRSRVGNQINKKNSFYNPASKTVYVTNIPLQLVQELQNLLNIFKPYGTVTKHNIEIKDKKVTAFLEFDSLQSALKSICFLHNTYHYGKLIQIFFTRTILN